jgi:hypothetical protein
MRGQMLKRMKSLRIRTLIGMQVKKREIRRRRRIGPTK